MIKFIPDEILERAKNTLDPDVVMMHLQSHQIYVSDILERLYWFNTIFIIRVNVYTDGKTRIIENTDRIETVDRTITQLLGAPPNSYLPNKCYNQAVLDLPVEMITFVDRITRGMVIKLYVDSEYLDKLHE